MLRKILKRIRQYGRSCAWKARNQRFGSLLRKLKLSHTFATGVRIDIQSMADWTLYTDIFVSGEYDLAIRSALEQAKGCCRVLDLGANVGFFAKRVIHIRRSEFPNVALDLICIEGLPSTHMILQESFPRLLRSEKSTLLHGLAGERVGCAYIQSNPFHAMTSLVPGNRISGVKVPFLDLQSITNHWDDIDLLKCDIEGSEERFLHAYPELIARTKTAVFEFHLDRVDRSICRRRLSEGGLVVGATLHENKYISLELSHRRRTEQTI
jgi:FkbM family methyltransferase